MEDQLMALKKLGVNATMLSASATPAELKQTQEAMLDKNSPLKILYVTPEKLAKSKRFMAKLEKMYELGRFARLVIDEVHCCSQWGHDFRPDYKFLGIMKRQFPEVPILGLTATATLSVLKDVQTILNISLDSCYLFRASFNRPNLYYQVRHKPAAPEKVIDDMESLIKKKFKGKSGIVYCFSKKESEEITADLNKRGIKSGVYHADCSAADRSQVHQAWSSNKIQVVVATVAFGMGIDKPDVRFVIHHSISKSMENLYQESGRAGRDDQQAHCIVYYRLADVFRQSSMVFTEQTGLDNLMGVVDYCTNTDRCRRSMIARHFGEVWDKSHCNQMCDHCDPQNRVNSQTVDISGMCADVITILDHAAAQQQRLTAIKLIDTWQGKGTKPMKGSGASVTTASREECELILAIMLLRDYIKEDFHFTPYATISYLVPGTKAVTMRHGSEAVTVTVEPGMFEALPKVQKPKDKLSSAANKDMPSSTAIKDKPTTSTAQKDKTSLKKDKPDLVIINPEKSHFKSQPVVSNAKKRSPRPDTKRKAPIVISDNDEPSTMDFCDYLAGSPPETPKFLADSPVDVSPKKQKRKS
ncbi:ATP-dependent DNA helicase Q1-like isoform X2 [Liolophura sinensis]